MRRPIYIIASLSLSPCLLFTWAFLDEGKAFLPFEMDWSQCCLSRLTRMNLNRRITIWNVAWPCLSVPYTQLNPFCSLSSRIHSSESQTTKQPRILICILKRILSLPLSLSFALHNSDTDVRIWLSYRCIFVDANVEWHNNSRDILLLDSARESSKGLRGFRERRSRGNKGRRERWNEKSGRKMRRKK